MCVGRYGRVSVDTCTRAEVRGQASSSLAHCLPPCWRCPFFAVTHCMWQASWTLRRFFFPFPIHPLVGVLGSQVGDLSLSVFIQSGDPNWVELLVKTITAPPPKDALGNDNNPILLNLEETVGGALSWSCQTWTTRALPAELSLRPSGFRIIALSLNWFHCHIFMVLGIFFRLLGLPSPPPKLLLPPEDLTHMFFEPHLCP